MTREESIKILSILKAAYPNSYKGMTKDEANGTISIWTSQFANMPYYVVAIAVNKLIGTNTFPPAINEVKKMFGSLYWECYTMLDERRLYGLPALDEKTNKTVKEILRITEPYSKPTGYETPLRDILECFGDDLLPEGSDVKRIGTA